MDTLAKNLPSCHSVSTVKARTGEATGKGARAHLLGELAGPAVARGSQSSPPAPAAACSTKCFAHIIPPTGSPARAPGAVLYLTRSIKCCALLRLLFLSESLLSGCHCARRNFCSSSEPEEVLNSRVTSPPASSTRPRAFRGLGAGALGWALLCPSFRLLTPSFFLLTVLTGCLICARNRIRGIQVPNDQDSAGRT